MDASFSEYDQIRDHITGQVVEITAHYGLGQVGREGARVIFRCPSCNKEKLTANPNWLGGPVTGCWNADCSVPNSLSPVNFIAHMEGLDPKSQYKMVLDQGNRITAAPLLQARDRAAGQKKSRPNSSSSSNAGQNGDQYTGSNKEQPEDPTLTDSVYRKLITSCGLTPEAWSGLTNRGLTKQTILDAGIGYISAAKAQVIMKALYDEFGDDLARVPGFYSKEKSAIGYWSNFAGKDLILFPYHDSRGLIRTVEGRVMFGKEDTVKYKYLSLTGSGSHLYVYPGMGFDNIEGFCEGLFGAILAAQEGICIASIQGFRRYRASGGRYPLPELEGANFAGRTIPYIPDMDSPPNPEVAAEAPEAARWLVERQGGRPIIALLPSGKDLDEYLLLVQSQKRLRAFDKLIELSSYTLEEYTERIAAAQGPGTTKKINEDAANATNDTNEAHTEQPAHEQNESSGEDPANRSMDGGRESGETGDQEPGDDTYESTAGTQDKDDAGNTDEVQHHDSHDELVEDPHEDPGDEPEHDPGQEPHNEPHDEPQEDQHEEHNEEHSEEHSEEHLDEFAPAAQLTGEQFYRQDLNFPEEPPNPKTALAGRVEAVGGEDAETAEEDPWYKRLRAYLTLGIVAILKTTAATTFKLFTIFIALYLALVILFAVLTTGGAFEGMWKWLTLTIVVCALLRWRLGSRTRRFKEGKITPGQKT